MIEFIQLVSLILTLGYIECYEFQARIGNYSRYVPDFNKCGLSKINWVNTFERPNKCFKYHPNQFAPMKNGRDALEWEAPWVVRVQTTIDFNWWDETWNNKKDCTGSLISPHWVITAAHCFNTLLHTEDGKSNGKIWIFSGIHFKKDPDYIVPSKTPIIHPLYNRSLMAVESTVDLALLYLDNPFQIENNGEYYTKNFICLPDRDMRPPNGREIVFYSAWGVDTFGTTTRTTYNPAGSDHLQIGSKLLTQVNTGFHRKIFRAQPVLGDQNELCSGDSGSPLWQYSMGRAVLIGIHSSGYPRRGSPPGECAGETFGPYIPSLMNWIIESIK